ncbi:carbohydrate ABC transporter permease [Lyngbya sp. CCY1209]|jgi:multiple sugar transport system permease protein|uniref:carbohydrate ABC transporter permease n=1 Tax=Lyngbya sp. CCY1209 TaxID=2886103 RepID=UPI002D1FDD84|nr:carbohydrate ABC transporter permease [Lyngbya sp. CCY1209]MEB3882983.1 carbohydrate ABC transporter permease [Lyngbya sp. CCY1209]
MSVTNQPAPESQASGKINYSKIALWVGVVLTIIFCLAPVMWQLLTSFKTNEAISTIPNIYFPSPDQLTWDHYGSLGWGFLRYVFNSAFVSLTSTVLCLGVGAPAAYTLTRLKIPGENIILVFILVISLFPYVLLFLGLLEIVKALGLGNNYIALIIPYTAINLPLTILVLRSFFQQLPKDLEDSAKIDGYSTLEMLLQIVLPMTLPALVTTGILTFIFAWNEFIFALTFITREEMYTIPVAVAQIGGASVFEIPYGPIAAATVTGTIPLVILVLIFQRRIVQGITAGAVKG